jgi:tetratricopeptide (TPR) repeat protein
MNRAILSSCLLLSNFLVCLPAARCETPAGVAASPAECPALANLAESKAQAGQLKEAIEIWERVVALNPVVGDYWARLARAQYDAKDYRNSIATYQKTLELGAGSVANAAYNIACCYALLGEKENALKWLDKSFTLGFRSLRMAREDDDLKCLHDNQHFRDLVSLVDTKKMSRVDGWRYDLQLFVRELNRIHYILSKKTHPKEFDASVQKLHDDIPKLTDHQIEVAIMKLASMAGDGHTEANPRYLLKEHRRAIPVDFYLFEEGLFIASAAPAHRELAGCQVLRCGNHPVTEVLAALDPLVSRDNTMWPRLLAPSMMRNPQILNGLGVIPEDDRVTLTLRDPDGKERTVTLQADASQPTDAWIDASAATTAPQPLCRKNLKAHYWFEYLPDSKLVYFQYNAVQNDPKEPLDKFCKRLFEFIDKHDVDKLVIDMRYNGGGNNFLNRPLVEGLIRCDKINQRGKLFVIVGRNTFSAAQCGATQIERYSNAMFVGEPSGSCPNFVGESCLLELPYSKILTSISDLYWQNSVAMDHRTWIGPQIYTPPTFEAYRAKRDSAMEAVLAFRAKE